MEIGDGKMIEIKDKIRETKNCEDEILNYLKSNPDKNLSIYDLFVDFNKKYVYHAVYIAVKFLEAKKLIKLTKDSEGVRSKLMIKLI